MFYESQSTVFAGCFWTVLDLAVGAVLACTVNFFTLSIRALAIKAQSVP